MAALQWNALTRKELIEARGNRHAWATLYEDVRAGLDVLGRLLKIEFAAFREQSGKQRLALADVRRKSKNSFVEKIIGITDDDTRLEEQLKGRRLVTIFDLVQDLCAGRLVFYFERDVQDALIFWLTFPTYLPVEVTHWVQDLSGYDTAMPAAARWLKNLGSPERSRPTAPKLSGYESLHVILGINVDLLRARTTVAARRASMAIDEEHNRALAALGSEVERHKLLLKCTRIEIQCRTILEHTWAEIEHRARYSVVKAKRGGSASTEEQVRTFRNYKAILRAAQIYQNTLKTGFGRWDVEEAALAGRSTNVEIGPRDLYWSPQDRERLRVFNDYLTDAMASARDTPPRRHGIWQDAYDQYLLMVHELGGNAKLHLHIDQSAEEYGRRRLLVMLLGFILAYAPSPGTEGTSIRAQAALLYYEKNVDEESRFWIPSEVAAVRLYEQLKLLDAYFSKDEPESLFYDPLVEARAASVYFRHFGSLRRSTALLEETLQRAPKWKPASGHHFILSPKYLGHRLAENYWAAYNLEGRREEDLSRALERAIEALSGEPVDHTGGSERELDQKLSSHLLAMTLYYVVGKFREQLRGEARWRVLASVRESLSEMWDVLKLHLEDRAQVESSTLRLQGRALLLACEAEMEEGTSADRILVESRLDARAARRNVERKLRDRAGGVLAFHVEVAREVEEFIFSLCSQDREASG